jgi:hypothetical protein
MKCLGCGSPKPVGEAVSFTYCNFGVVGSALFDQADPRHWAFSASQARNYQTTFTVGFQSRGADEENPYDAQIEFNGSHPDLPKPDLVPLQTEFYFCGIPCLRDWFVRITERLEQLTKGAPSTAAGQVNPDL